MGPVGTPFRPVLVVVGKSERVGDRVGERVSRSEQVCVLVCPVFCVALVDFIAPKPSKEFYTTKQGRSHFLFCFQRTKHKLPEGVVDRDPQLSKTSFGVVPSNL